MKAFLCLLMAAVVGAGLQYGGVPHGLLLGSIFATALIVSIRKFSLRMPLGLGYVQIGDLHRPDVRVLGYPGSRRAFTQSDLCLLYTSDAADE